MLSACIASEKMKIKHSNVRLVFILMPLVPAFMGTMNYLNNLELLQSKWYSLWTQETLFYSNFFFAPLIAVYCSYLWRMENMNKNRHLLMTVPVAARDLFCGKLAALGKIVLFTQLWVFFLFFVSGKLAGLPGLPPFTVFLYVLRGILGGMVIAALQLLLSMIIRSFAAPVAIAVLGSITGLLAASTGPGILYPYSLMMLGMNANRDENMLAGNGILYVAGSLFYILLFTIIATVLLKRRDVRG